MTKAKIVARNPVTIVLLIGTCVLLLISEKNDGSSPSLAIAINIRGCIVRMQRVEHLLGKKRYNHLVFVCIVPILNLKQCENETCGSKDPVNDAQRAVQDPIVMIYLRKDKIKTML